MDPYTHDQIRREVKTYLLSVGIKPDAVDGILSRSEEAVLTIASAQLDHFTGLQSFRNIAVKKAHDTKELLDGIIQDEINRLFQKIVKARAKK